MSKQGISLFNFTYLILFLALCGACDDTICSSVNSSLVNVKFFDRQLRTPRLTGFDSITAAGTDSIFYIEDTSGIYVLPLNTLSDSTLFLFINSGIADTLLVHYDRSLQLISKDCGYSETLALDSVLYSTFPEVIIKNKILSTTIESNIEIYY